MLLPPASSWADIIDLSPKRLMQCLRAWARQQIKDSRDGAGVTACALFGYAEMLTEDQRTGLCGRMVIAGLDETADCRAMMGSHRGVVPLTREEHRHFCLSCVNCVDRDHHVPLDVWPTRAQLFVLVSRCNGIEFQGG